MTSAHALHGALCFALLLCGSTDAQATTRFAAELGTSTVMGCSTSAPGPTGAAVLYLHEPGNVLVYNVSVTGMAAPLTAHLHAGVGICGPVLAFLGATAGSWFGRLDLTTAQVAALRAGGLYLNVQSLATGDQIRGQIAVSDPSEFSVALTPMPGAPPSAIGHGFFELLPDGRLFYLVRTTGLSGIVGNFADLSVGFTLSGGPTTWIGITSVAVPPGGVASLRANAVSVTVHTAMNPAGEIQGTILARRRPVVFGSACPGSGGVPAEINATNIACIGAAYRLEVYGAAPLAPALLVLGASSMTGIPFGPGCRFYIDQGLLVAIPMTTGPQGWVHYNVAIPYDYKLLGGTLDAQWLVTDAVPGGTAASNAMRARIE